VTYREIIESNLPIKTLIFRPVIRVFNQKKEVRKGVLKMNLEAN